MGIFNFDKDLITAQGILQLENISSTADYTTERYGSKMPVTMSYFGEQTNGTIITLLPGCGTGRAPKESKLESGHKVMRSHDKDAHEWVIRLDSLEGILKKIRGFPSIEMYTNQHDFGRCPIEHQQLIFPAHVTQYELKKELFENPENPQGVTFRYPNVHSLFNPNDHAIPLLIIAAEKGKPLDKLQCELVEKTGGLNTYFLRLDQTTGQILN